MSNAQITEKMKEKLKRKFGALIIGDEILSGKRKDKHFEKLIFLLGKRGIELSWSMYLPDDRDILTSVLMSTMKREDIVFSCGGIGATPDDHTRQCAASATGVGLELHPEAKREIEQAFGKNAYPRRIEMGIFPAGCSIIPNPYNRIPGFTIKNHHFLPGFPVMAWPMIEWVLDTVYTDQHFLTDSISDSIIVKDAGESQLIDLMEQVMKHYPLYKVFSLPTITNSGRQIELGVKGPKGNITEVINYLQLAVEDLGFAWKPAADNK